MCFGNVHAARLDCLQSMAVVLFHSHFVELLGNNVDCDRIVSVALAMVA